MILAVRLIYSHHLQTWNTKLTYLYCSYRFSHTVEVRASISGFIHGSSKSNDVYFSNELGTNGLTLFLRNPICWYGIRHFKFRNSHNPI